MWEWHYKPIIEGRAEIISNLQSTWDIEEYPLQRPECGCCSGIESCLVCTSLSSTSNKDDIYKETNKYTMLIWTQQKC